ncbi:phosphate ABC transporter substrate-binding protein [bacterium]|nr:phosphate ABC transporter substrate-binding protein [bacterium]
MNTQKTLLVFFLLFIFCLPLMAQSGAVKVIVNQGNSVSSLTKKEVSDIFMKKNKDTWQNGSGIIPVDQVFKSKTHEAFCDIILNKSGDAVNSYWCTRIYSGRDTPPVRLSSDKEVLEYVAGNAGAIGYISGSAGTEGFNVKVIQVQ